MTEEAQDQKDQNKRAMDMIARARKKLAEAHDPPLDEGRLEDMIAEGTWVQMRGNVSRLILPALLSDVPRIRKMIGDLTQDLDPGDEETNKRMVEFCHFALRQAYPAVTLDEIKKEVTISSFWKIFQVVMKSEGLDSFFADTIGLTPEEKKNLFLRLTEKMMMERGKPDGLK